jgi:hypothetical protein
MRQLDLFAEAFSAIRNPPSARSRASSGLIVRAARAGKEVNKMVQLAHPELLETLSPTTEHLAEASGTLAPGIPEIPGIPEMVPAAPVGSPAVPVPEDDIPLASSVAPASEPVAAALPEVSAVFAELPAVQVEPA